MWKQALCALLVAAPIACVGMPDEDLVATVAYGRPAPEYSGVVRVETPHGLCSGVVLGRARKVILTAAHCVGYVTAEGDLGEVVFDVGYEARRRIVRARSYGSALGANDLALLALDCGGPEEALPFYDFTAEAPGRGRAVTFVGFGCAERDDRVFDRIRRSSTFAYGVTARVTCPGDSGGPLLLGGRVAAIASGYSRSTGEDVWAAADASRPFFDALVEQCEAWGALTDAPSCGEIR